MTGKFSGNTYTFSVVQDGTSGGGGSSGRPDLAFYKPSDWPASIFLSNVYGGTTAKTSFSVSDQIYMNFAIGNLSSYAVSAFKASVFIYSSNGSPLYSWNWTFNDGLPSSSFRRVSNDDFPSLSAGTYSVRVTLDSESAVSESNEGNNTTTLYFSVENPGGLNPVYRFYSPRTKSHFFTISGAEVASLRQNSSAIWNFEGIAYYAYRTQVSGTVPLYRFYCPIDGKKGHFYTKSEAEKNELKAKSSHIWNYEGIAYYVAASQRSGTTPVYRFWAPGAKHHFYTRSESEKNNLVATAKHIWNYEGIGFYAWQSASSSYYSVSAAPVGVPWANDENVHQSPMAASPAPASPRRFAKEAGDDLNDHAAFGLVALLDGTPLPDEGEAEVGDVAVEIRANKPEDGSFAPELDDDWEGEAVALRLLLPDGVFSVLQRDEDTGGVVDGEAEGAVDFDLPASGAWYQLRVKDAEGEEAYSRWMKAE